MNIHETTNGTRGHKRGHSKANPELIPSMSGTELFQRDAPNLLGDRWLTPESAAIVLAPKNAWATSFLAGAAVPFAQGKPFLGIQPIGPLKIAMIVPSANMSNLADALQGAGASRDTLAGVSIHESDRWDGERLLDEVAGILATERPDLLMIDAIDRHRAFGGGDSCDERAAIWKELRALLMQFNCGLLASQADWRPIPDASNSMDHAVYCFARMGIYTKAARGVLAMLPTDDPDVCRLTGIKKGYKLGWPQPPMGEVESRLIRWSGVEGGWKVVEQQPEGSMA